MVGVYRNIEVQQKSNSGESIFQSPANNAYHVDIDTVVTDDYINTNVLSRLQDISNKTIAPNGAYWEEANLTQYATESLDWSLAHICNVNDFYVIACPYDYTDPDTQEYTHKFYIYYSSDGGYHWTLTRQTSANTSTKISKINNMAMQATSIGYRLVILGTNEESPNVLNSYSVLFVYNANGSIKTEEDNTYTMPFSVIVNQFVNSSLITEIGTKVYNSPQGFMAITPSGSVYLSSYLYDYKFSTNGIANGSSNFGYFNWTLIGDLGLDTSESGIEVIDACFDSRINRMLFVIKSSDSFGEYHDVGLFSPYSNSSSFDVTSIYDYVLPIKYELFTAFDKTFIVKEDSDMDEKTLNIVAYNIKDNNYQALSIDLPDAEGHICLSFGGNKHRLYAIRDDGVVTYMYQFNIRYQSTGTQEGNINGINYLWSIANQSANTEDRMFTSLKNYQINSTDSIDMNICCSTNNNDIVGIYHNMINNSIADTYILHTHTNSAH